MFILNNLYDYVALDFIYRHMGVSKSVPAWEIMRCVIKGEPVCPKSERNAYLLYANKMQRAVASYLGRVGNKSAAFLINRAGHCELMSKDYNALTIHGVSIRQAIEAWFFKP